MTRTPISRGALLALLAAILFGATTPIIKHFGAGVGPFATATLLYVGAAIGSGGPSRRAAEAKLRREHAGRLLVVALFGAALAPVCLAWGLQRAGALASSLLLNLEAVFTVFLALIIYREPIGKRVALAVALMVAGGAALAIRASADGVSSALGLVALGVATLGWALDNTLTRPLADFDSRAVVFWKALLGAAMSGAIAAVASDRWPGLSATAALLACGATGYGLSLRLYLGAQRTLGAARTGSLFAFAPFVGAALAFGLGDRANASFVAIAATLFVAAVYLHITEAHGHRHGHEPLAHEHAHSHNDGHHTHTHDPAVRGEHSHSHEHDAMIHEHPHGPDLHHRHGHE